MNTIMSRYSSAQLDGVPTFTFDPTATENQGDDQQLTLPGLSLIDDLASDLLRELAGQTLSVEDVIASYNTGLSKHYTERNYKDALLELESNGQVTMSPKLSDRPSRSGRPTLADRVRVSFPE